VRVFLAGGVPEVMLHLRRFGLLALDVLTVTSRTLGAVLDEWEKSERRTRFRAILREQDGVDPDDVILPPDAARARGLTSTVTFPRGNIAPEGSVVKSTAIDPSVLDAQGVLRREGPARVFTSEHEAIAAIKKGQIQPGDILVVLGCGPIGTGMEETYQLTSALKFVPFGKEVALVTDARFSGVSTGACIGHVGPEGARGRSDRQAEGRRPGADRDRRAPAGGQRRLRGRRRPPVYAGGGGENPSGPPVAHRRASPPRARHTPLGGDAAGRRRHMGRLRLRRGPDRGTVNSTQRHKDHEVRRERIRMRGGIWVQFPMRAISDPVCLEEGP